MTTTDAEKKILKEVYTKAFNAEAAAQAYAQPSSLSDVLLGTSARLGAEMEQKDKEFKEVLRLANALGIDTTDTVEAAERDARNRAKG